VSKIYRDLGVEPIINAAGTMSAYSGNLMHPEVTDAMNEASRAFVIMKELHLAAGKRIAELVGAPAAHVCSSATAGIALTAAAAVTGTDLSRVRRLPHVEGLPHKIIVQKTQRMAYDQAIELSGCRFVEIDPTPEALEAAIDEQTAGVWYVFGSGMTGPDIPLPQVTEIAHRHGIPVLVDGASELPPVSNLHRYLDEGADLAIFSGGKGLRGPQASGMIIGRPDLVEACRLNDCPNPAIGRSMKMGKEEIVGLVKAVEIYMRRDHEADMLVWERRVQYIVEQVSQVPTLKAWRQMPYGTGQLYPFVAMTWDVSAVEVSYQEFFDQMLGGSPRIMPQQHNGSRQNGEPQIHLHVHTLQEGQEAVVARRVLEILGS